jgi:hypothetical protein
MDVEISEMHPCPDEDCAVFITESDDPFVCIHYEANAEAIDYWGKVARGQLDVDDVIEPYREFLDFSEATSLSDHYDGDWTGPTVEVEVRVNHEPVETFTAYPHDRGFYPGFETVLCYAEGYAEGRYAEARDSSR